MKKIILLVFILLLFGGNALAEDDAYETVNARITDVKVTEEAVCNEYRLTMYILEGQFKGELISLNFVPIRFSQYDFEPREGMTVLLSVYHSEAGIHADVLGLSRQSNLTILFAIFFILLLIFGRKQGFLSLIALVLSGVIIFFFLIPMVLRGHNVVLLTVVTAAIVVVLSFIIISGFTKKSLASILGTIGGIISAVVVAEIFCHACGITGSVSEEAYLMVCDNGVEIDFAGLFISGIIIGTIGVVMDVSMSVTSVILELKCNAPKMRYAELVSSGIKVGKDMMATMINTLILAYVGTSMPLLFVFIGNASSFKKVINMEIVAGEIIRSLCGSIGLIFTVPLTAIIASSIIMRAKHNTRGTYAKHRAVQRRR